MNSTDYLSTRVNKSSAGTSTKQAGKTKNNITRVRFRPTKLIDPVKQGGTIRVGKTLEGEMLERKDGGKIVYFEDKNGQSWVFWAGCTCEILKES